MDPSLNTELHAAAADDAVNPSVGDESRTTRDGAPHGASAPAAWLSRLLDQTSQPFLATDFEGQITYFNPAFEALIGYSADELRRRNIRDITPERWQSTTPTALERLNATGQAQRYEKEYVARDGQTLAIEVVTDFFRDDQGCPRGYCAFISDIGRRKRAEQALRESEERFRRLFDEAPFGYHEIDTEGKIIRVNRTECELLGYTREEMVGRSILDFVRPDLRDEARRAIAERIRGDRTVQTVERAYITKDGRELPVHIESRLLCDNEGRVVGIRSTMQDITLRKQAEAALVASERRIRALFEGIEDAVFVHDLEGRILDANPAASRRLGYTHEEFLRLTTRDVDAPDFAAGYRDRLDAQLREGHLSCEGRHRTKDGRIIPVEINTSTIFLGDQKAVLAVIRDITERKALEETRQRYAESQLEAARAIEAKNRALERSEVQYRQLTEGCLDAIVVCDREGHITLFNPAAEQTFGYPAAEAIGQPLSLLMTGALPEDPSRGLSQALTQRDASVVGHTIEMKGRRRNGEEFPLEISLSVVDLFGEPQFIGAIRDQTESQRMRAMLMQSEKLASIGLLSAGVAHEINNPLAFIANNLAVLERDLAGVLAMMAAYESADGALANVAPEVVEKVHHLSDDLDWPYVRENLGRMLTRTREGVQRVANIVQNLRGLARTAPPTFEACSLSDLMTSALEMVRGRLRKRNIEVRLEVQENLPKLSCVSSQISQVFLNLLVNAIQAIEERDRPDDNLMKITIRRQPGAQVVEVCDNGIGIDPEAIPRLFDPFYTTKAVGEGTGLGLSISHGIVSGHGGRIEIESRMGEGACFRVILPDRRGQG